MSTRIYPAIDAEIRSHVETALAAHWLGRKPQTLHVWSCQGSAPLRPVRIHGRLSWPVAEIKRLLSGDAAQ